MSILMNRPKNMLDIYKLLPEGTPIQLINNRFYMSPALNIPHFEIVDSLTAQLRDLVIKNNSGKIFFAPVDVYLGTRNAVQPDIMFIHKERLDIIHTDGIHSAPDLIIEVLSPSNKNDDLIKKKEVYEAFGVKEYFIVDPSDKSVTTYYLKEKSFVEQKQTKGKITSKILKKTFAF